MLSGRGALRRLFTSFDSSLSTVLFESLPKGNITSDVSSFLSALGRRPGILAEGTRGTATVISDTLLLRRWMTGTAGSQGGRGKGRRGISSLLRDYKQLSKFRLSTLVVATAAAGFVAGSEEWIDWPKLGWTSVGTFLAASSANALNQVYEVLNDGRMRRTASRPLPSGRMSRTHALVFAAVTGASGVWVLLKETNGLTAALGAGNIALYAGMYTPLKQLSVINTWIGALVGAIPPLMGWAAASGGLDLGALLLAAGLYFWQMPHFMALAWLCRADYAAGGYRMLSLIDATGRRTAACALRNCAYLFPLGILSAWLGVTTPYFAYESAFITAGMLLTAARFYSMPSNANARLLFRASLIHLPIFMAAFLLHRCPNRGEDRADMLLEHMHSLGLLQEVPFNKGRSSSSSLSGSDEPSAASLHLGKALLTEHNTELLQSSQQHTWSSNGSSNAFSMRGETSSRSISITATRPSNDGEFHPQSAWVPPVPFLPIPRLQFGCPSKAECSDKTTEVPDRDR